MRRNDFPKVLVGCPINVVKDYCMDPWLDMVKNLTYPNYDLYLVDNTKNPDYHKDLQKKHKVKIDWIDPAKKEARYYMAESIEKIRKKAVKGRYDYLCIIEVDIFPPAQIVELLMAHQKQVVGTTYWTGQGDKSFLQLLWLKEFQPGAYSAQFFSWRQIRRFFNGRVNRAFANGNGAILIKREVLEKLKFRVSDDDGGHADSFFHKDLFLLGIYNWIDTSIIPTHWNSRWSAMPDDADHAEMWERIKNNPERVLNKGISYNL